MLHYILIFIYEEQADGSLTTEGSIDTCSCSAMHKFNKLALVTYVKCN